VDEDDNDNDPNYTVVKSVVAAGLDADEETLQSPPISPIPPLQETETRRVTSTPVDKNFIETEELQQVVYAPLVLPPRLTADEEEELQQAGKGGVKKKRAKRKLEFNTDKDANKEDVPPGTSGWFIVTFYTRSLVF